ncbi:LysR family transcriptional regulator [Ramlibacter sp. AW1]|uniref:LysR family transcriptional regulator n=1 Tax=Ramlibacter aurantiacus TaxID=2801330 RepID=A0A937D3H6_9BURK|nr:LysR family transcriptional regulator [Ramlibacter aurantiacus]MBL0422674.1 LysR family transcriptional regulator [Ramlibacter aurantiacus]
MDASAFEYFHAVARTGSISRASVELGMEPSTVTRHIARLEQDAGVKLFHRSGRGMLLTDAGALLLQEAGKVVDTLQHARRVAADLAAGGPSQIVVAAQPTIVKVCFAAMAHALRSRYPRARVRVIEGSAHELVSWLHQGKVDAALLYVPHLAQGHAGGEVLLREPLHCIFPAVQPAPPGPVTVPAALELPLILPSTSHGLRALAESWAQRHGKSLDVVLECDGSTSMTRRMVQAGLGCTILPLASVEEEVGRGLLQAVRIEGPEALRSVVLATAQNRPPVTGLLDITHLLRDTVFQLVDAGRWPGVDRRTA